MSTQYFVQAHVLKPNSINFGAPGQTESPFITGVKQALEKLGSTLESAELTPSPFVDPPMYIAAVSASKPVPNEALKTKLQELWPTLKDAKGTPFPTETIIEVRGG